MSTLDSCMMLSIAITYFISLFLFKEMKRGKHNKRLKNFIEKNYKVASFFINKLLSSLDWKSSLR